LIDKIRVRPKTAADIDDVRDAVRVAFAATTKRLLSDGLMTKR
jgi:hypothetical protein